MEFSDNTCYTVCITHSGGSEMLKLPALPPHMRQASEKQKGQNWFVELLIFFLVFLVASTTSSFIMIPGIVIAVFSDKSILEQFTGGAPSDIGHIAARIESSVPVTIFMLFANAGLILIAILFCVVLQRRKLASMGIVKEKALTQYLIGLGIGFALFAGAVLLNVITGSMKLTGISPRFSIGLFLLFALGFMIQGMAEEVLCRGYLLVSVARRYPVSIAVFLNSLVFALLHLGNPGVSLLAVVNILLVGVFLSLYFLRTGNIWGVGAIHTMWNFAQGNIFGMEVSGMELSCSILESSAVPHKTFWNGGSFGPEAGFTCTIIYIAAILLVLLWKNKKADAEAQGCSHSLTVHGNEETPPHTGNGADKRLR